VQIKDKHLFEQKGEELILISFFLQLNCPSILSAKRLSIFEMRMHYKENGTNLVVQVVKLKVK
jgi:hypothetical protein